MKETRNITESSLKWMKLEYNGVLAQMKETRNITESSLKWKQLEI